MGDGELRCFCGEAHCGTERPRDESPCPACGSKKLALAMATPLVTSTSTPTMGRAVGMAIPPVTNTATPTMSRGVARTIATETTQRVRLWLEGHRHLGNPLKPFYRLLHADDWSRRLKRYVHLLRSFDRERDRYVESVVDPETGAVIHERDQPLTAHRGYGSDKKNKRT